MKTSLETMIRSAKLPKGTSLATIYDRLNFRSVEVRGKALEFLGFSPAERSEILANPTMKEQVRATIRRIFLTE